MLKHTRTFPEFTLVEPIFRELGVTPAWLYGMAYGWNKLYNSNTELLSYFYEKDVLQIYCGSIGDKKFSLPLLKDILKLVHTNEKVILPTSIVLSDNILKRYSVKSKDGIYFKGVETYE